MIATGFVALATDEPGLHEFRLTTAGLDLSQQLASLGRVSALVADEERQTLFAAYSNPVAGDETPSGRVVRYRLRRNNSVELTLLANAPSGGTTPCHLATACDRLFVANFRHYGAPGGLGAASQGSLGVLHIEGDVGLTLNHSVRFPGSSIHPDRQTCSHPHCVVPFADDSVLVADLGTDRIWRYRYGANGSYECVLDLPAGSGPRRLALPPNRNRLYVVNEISSTVYTCAFTPEGVIRVIGQASILPNAAKGGSVAGDIEVTYNGQMIFATNRGQNSVAVLDSGDGQPVVLDHVHLNAPPGDFVLHGAGYLLVPVANTLVVCRANESRRTLSQVASYKLPGSISALCCLG